MASKEINVLPWIEAEKLLSNNKTLNSDFLKIVSEICQYLKKDKNDYVYHMKLPFGEKIIDKGSIFIESCFVKENSFQKTKEDFFNDIQYSSDPLGIVLKNHLEVYTENKSNNVKYTFPLNILRQGDIFGVFGVLDFLSEIKSVSIDREWFVRAGNVSFGVSFPFHNRNELQLLEHNNFDHLSGRNEKTEQSPGDNKVAFIRNFVDDWYAEIAYFPKHFFDNIPESLMLKFQNQLYKIGWNQSAPLRNDLFEDTTVFDMLSSPYFKVRHEKTFLNILYHYIKNTAFGLTYIMRPLTEDHIINIALKRFKEQNDNYFSSNKSNEPLPFIYSRLENENDWGLVSVYHLPIMYNYEVHSLNNLLKDIDDINKKIEGNLNISNHYKLQYLEGYGNTGGRSVVRSKKTDIIRKRLSEIFRVDISRVNLNSKEFSNLLLIKKQKINVS